MDVEGFDATLDLAHASTLPSRFYLDPKFLDLEIERIFARTWQPVCRSEMVMRPGDYFVCDSAGEPIVIVRGTDGVLRAMSNVCRHRAGEVAVGKGNRKSLQCRYHGWTYTLEGKLFTQPEFEGVQNWNKSEICLPQFRAEKWGPIIFTCLDSNALGLMQMMGKIPDEVHELGIDLDRLKLIERRDYVVNCNWKVYIDNYLEGYHIPMAHPGLFRE